MYKNRLLEERITAAARYFPVILLVGARQVGKSTLLRHLYPDIPVVTFSPIHDVQHARAEPDIFLNQFSGPVVLDEVQFAPELLASIKMRVDEKPGLKGQYFLTGSQNFSVLKSVAESMAGRVAIFDLSTMTFGEFYGDGSQEHWLLEYLRDPASITQDRIVASDKATLPEALWRGGFPGLIGMPDEQREMLLSSYIQTYVDRDIRTLSQVDRIDEYRSFISIVAALSSQEVNYNHLGREIGVGGATAQRWLQLLQATYLWRTVPAYTGNVIKRITSKKKGYFIDTGLMCYLHRIAAPQDVLDHPLKGSLFETYVANMISTVLSAAPTSVGMYHWRANGGAEVDIVLEQNGCLYPIEIKMTGNAGSYDARGIKSFHETYAKGAYRVMPGVVVYGGSTCYPINTYAIAMPWNAFLKGKK